LHGDDSRRRRNQSRLSEFIQTARQLTEKTGALLILDEIQCGLGRTGRWFAYEHYGLKPDIVTVAKPLAAGLPLGAILTTNRVASGMHPGLHGTTFGGGPLASAVAIEFLNQVGDMLGHVNETGSYFRGQLESLAAKHSSIREIRGRGLMLGVDMTEPDIAKAAVQHLLDRGILINRTRHRAALPTAVHHQKKHVDQVVSALDSALSANPAVATRASKTRRGKAIESAALQINRESLSASGRE
jgi:acetylornithine aminotransferase/acetylornithine/N-succinyldiaminopimelate aminotransferase